MDNIVPNYKTIKEAELEINPPKELCKDRDCKKGCKCKEQNKNIIEKMKPFQELFNKGQEDYTKQQIYNQIRLLVNTQSNDMLLGEAVRKLFL